MRQYATNVIDDDALPAEHDWLFIEVDDAVHFVVKRSKAKVRTIRGAWDDYLERS